MQESRGLGRMFTKDKLDAIARIWACSNISLLDVRHSVIDWQHPLQDYRLPSSLLVCTYGGQARIWLDEATYVSERLGIIHGGKGMTLSIKPVDEHASLGAYLVLYRAEQPLFFQKGLLRLLDQVNPFIHRFAYTPDNPLMLLEGYRRMLDGWRQGSGIGQLSAKSTLYQMILEIYKELAHENLQLLQPEPALYAKRYLDAHFRDPITFQEIADRFAISGGQLTRLFKKQEGVSLQEYVIRKRLEVASHYLLHTQMTIKEIAYGCGFMDDNNLLRMFKKRYSISPSEYRKINTAPMPIHAVDNNSQRPYNENRLTGSAETQRDGAFTLLGQRRSKEMILAAAMSMMLLLSACSSTVPGGATNQIQPAVQHQQASSSHTPKAAHTRTIQTEQGEIEVPLNPQRVFLHTVVGDALALGVKPIGVAYVARQPIVSEMLPDDVAVLEAWEPDLEAIMELEPDLIIAPNIDLFESYSKIAPTVMINPWSITVEERLHALGDALNKQAEAEQYYAEHRALVEEARQQIIDAGLADTKITVIELGNDNYNAVYGNRHGYGYLLYQEFGLPIPAAVQSEIVDTESWAVSPSMEVLHTFTEDLVIVIPNPAELKDEIATNELWNLIPAVQQGNIVFLDAKLSDGDSLPATRAQIEAVVGGLLAHAGK